MFKIRNESFELKDSKNELKNDIKMEIISNKLDGVYTREISLFF
jgi:hypothetical protein